MALTAPDDAAQVDDLELLPQPKVCTLLGISAMTLWRWRRSPELDFPEPIYICGRLYWRRRALNAFLERQAGRRSER